MNRHVTRFNLAGAVGAWIWLAVIIVPVYYIVVTSLRPQRDYFTDNPLSWPSNPTLAAYGRVLDAGFTGFLLNSVVVTVTTVAVTLAVCLMAAHVIVNGRGWLGRGVFRLALLGIAIPIQAAIIPVYYLIVTLGLYDTLAALILPSVAFAIPVTLLILTSFLRDVPRSLFESMRIDGAGEWTILLRLVLPMSRPALSAIGVYNALQVWNGFLFPLVLTQSADTRVLPLSLWSFKGQFAIDVPAVLAAVVLSVLPMLAAYILARRHLVSGMTAGFGR